MFRGMDSNRRMTRPGFIAGLLLFCAAALFPAVASRAADGPNLGRIAIIGDSITQASGSAYSGNVYPQNACRGYRWHLFKQLVDSGATFTFAGSLSNNYTSDSQYPTWRGLPFDRATEGHFAWRASDGVL
jgi:hypothetical protein